MMWPSRLFDGVAPDGPRYIPCIRCGYNLRGIASDGLCPECGASVAISLRPQFLIFAEPSYVRSLKRGAGFLLLSLAVGLAMILVRTAVIVLAIIYALPVLDPRFQFAMTALALPVFALFGPGWWMLTKRDRGANAPKQRRTLPALTRFCVAVFIAASLVAMTGVYLRGVPHIAAQLTLLLVAGLCGAGAIVAGAAHLRAVALRIPDRSVRRWATGTVIAVLVTLGSGGGIMGGQVMLHTGPTLPAMAQLPIHLLAGLCLYVLVFASPVALALFLLLLTRFHTCTSSITKWQRPAQTSNREPGEG